MVAALRAEIRHYERCLARIRSLHPDVFAAGMDLFEDEAALALWLCQPARALAGKIPIFQSRTKSGRTSVIQILRAIDHGVYL